MSIITDKKFIVPVELNSTRLDRFLKEVSPETTRREWRERILIGGIYVNKSRVRKLSWTVKSNDEVRWIEDSFTRYKGKKIEKKDIVFINEDIVSITKPVGMPALPTHGQVINSAQYQLIKVLKEMNIRPSFLYPLHRLDAPTSGVLIFALNKSILQVLLKAFRTSSVIKRYIAICTNSPPEREGAINAGILIPKGTDTESPVKIDLKRGLQSLTNWKLLSFNSQYNFSLVEFRPVTGRRHQVRAHSMFKGFPILGDSCYGCNVPFPPQLKERLYLHAYSYYISGFNIEITSPLPRSFLLFFPDIQKRLNEMS